MRSRSESKLLLLLLLMLSSLEERIGEGRGVTRKWRRRSRLRDDGGDSGRGDDGAVRRRSGRDGAARRRDGDDGRAGDGGGRGGGLRGRREARRDLFALACSWTTAARAAACDWAMA